MPRKRVGEREKNDAQFLLKFTTEQCEAQQALSGCSFDGNLCKQCHLFKAHYRAKRLFSAL